jgi:putative sigma-54 modulation protein
MKLQVHSIHFDADKKLLAFIQSKLNKLDQFYDRITGGEVFMKVDKDNNRDNKVLEIKINLPGITLFVKEQARSFEAAMDLAIEALKIQLKKFKEKLQEKASNAKLLVDRMDEFELSMEG